MSLVLFRHGQLSVDRSGLETRNNREEAVHIPTPVKKMFVSSDKRIAVAYTGREIDFTSPAFKEQLGVFRRVLTKLNGGVDGIEKTVHILSDYKDVIFFVMTSSVCYEVVKVTQCEKTGTHTGIMHPLPCDSWTSHGSGTHTAEYLIATKPALSNSDVFKLVAMYTPGLWETPLDQVTFDDLKPFVTRR